MIILSIVPTIAKPLAFILDEEYAEGISAIRSDLTTVKNYICIGSFKGMENMEDLIKKASPMHPEIEIEGEDECALYFTSSTTRAPKPVLHVHKNLVCVALNEVNNDRWEHSESLLMLPPFYHLAIGHLLGCMLA